MPQESFENLGSVINVIKSIEKVLHNRGIPVCDTDGQVLTYPERIEKLAQRCDGRKPDVVEIEVCTSCVNGFHIVNLPITRIERYDDENKLVITLDADTIKSLLEKTQLRNTQEKSDDS